MQDDHDLDAPGAHVERLPILGVATTFVTDHPAVRAAVRDAYGFWTAYAERTGPGRHPAGRGDGPVVTIRVGDAGGGAPDVATRPGGIVPRVVEPMRLAVEGAGVAGHADAARGRAEALVPPLLVAHPDRLIRDVVEPLTLFLLGRRDRQPVHAAAVARGGAAILLAGPSGAGKSTLTYAASRHGFSVLADEPVYVQLEPRLRVWGRRPRLHLPPEARDRFPELRDREPELLPTGKTKLVVDMPEGPRSAGRACLCVLRRNPDGMARLDRLEPAAAVRELTARLDPGFDLFAETIAERIARIAEGGAWTLALSSEPRDALSLLDEVAAAMEAGR